MPLPNFYDRLESLARAAEERILSNEKQYKLAHESEKEAAELEKKNFNTARTDALRRLKTLGLWPALDSIERAMLRIYGPSKDSSRTGRFLKKFSPEPHKNKSYYLGKEGRVKVLYQDIAVGQTTREPESDQDHKWPNTNVPAFSLSAVCLYTPEYSGLAISTGLHSGSRRQEALFKDPRKPNAEIVLPYVPLMDWTKDRIQELAWDIITSRGDMNNLVGQLNLKK